MSCILSCLYSKVSDPYDRHVNKVVLWSSTCGFNIGRDCLKPNGLRVPTLLVKILKLDTVKPHNLKACMKNDILTSNLDTFDRMVYVWRFMSSFFNNRPKSTSIKHKYLTGIWTICKGHSCQNLGTAMHLIREVQILQKKQIFHYQHFWICHHRLFLCVPKPQYSIEA